jgi:hypothetical protein
LFAGIEKITANHFLSVGVTVMTVQSSDPSPPSKLSSCVIVGLKSDGTVVARDFNVFGQCNVRDWRNIGSVDIVGK